VKSEVQTNAVKEAFLATLVHPKYGTRIKSVRMRSVRSEFSHPDKDGRLFESDRSKETQIWRDKKGKVRHHQVRAHESSRKIRSSANGIQFRSIQAGDVVRINPKNLTEAQATRIDTKQKYVVTGVIGSSGTVTFRPVNITAEGMKMYSHLLGVNKSGHSLPIRCFVF